MNTFILKFQTLLIIQILGTKCFTIIENITTFVDLGDTVVLNCKCCREQSSWQGPDGTKALRNETVLMTFSYGQQINPDLNMTNIDIYGNFTIGLCHLRINNFSNANDGIYQCTYLHIANFYVSIFNIYSKKTPTNLKIVQAAENNIIYGREGVKLNLTCTVKNGLPAATLLWMKDDLTVANGSSDALLYQFTPTRFDHMQNITCHINSDLLTSPLSQTIQLDIQYRPNLIIIQRHKGSIVEGESMELCCLPNSNPHVQYIAWLRNESEIALWRQHATKNFDEVNKDFCFRILSVYRNHTGNYMCFAENSIAKSNSSIGINVLYPPDVIVTYTISEQSIMLNCNPDGNPDNYTFYNWEHRSDFNEHIRWFYGTPESQLNINKSQNRKATEDDGTYVCTVSNGVYNKKGKFNQEGQVRVESSASPVFVAENKPIQVGKFGRGVEIKVTIYDKLYNSTVLIRNNGTALKVKPAIENITTHDTFYGVNVRVTGIQYIFQLYFTSTNNFTNYTVEACNDVGCNYFYVQVISTDINTKSEKYCNSGLKIVGSILGGFFILSICLNIYCLLKHKQSSRMVPEIQLEVQYDEIGIIHDSSGSILDLSHNAQEAEISIDAAAVEETYPRSTPLEHNDSSDNSVQSLSTSLLSGDGYENPYQLIDPADIEIHPYSTVGSYLYQNTIIFPKQISSRDSNSFIPNDEKRNPWLVIYRKTCVNAWT